MPQPRSAGVYHREIDQSLFVPAVSSTIFACVGGAHKGELNTVIEVSSQSEYVKKLGIPTTPMGRAMFQYLRFGRQGLCVRVANGEADAVAQINDSVGAKTFTIYGKHPGEGYNGLVIWILESLISSSKFKLVVEEDGFPVETWDDLDKSSLGATLNDELTGSEYIRAVNDTGNTNPPAVNQSKTLAGGNSGITGLQDADYIGTKTGTTVTGLQCYHNPEDLDVDILAIPGNSSSAVIVAMLTLAENRENTYAIIDPPYGLDVDEVIDFHNGAGAFAGQHAAFNTHRACCDWPWHKVYDAYLEQEVWAAPSGFTAGIIAYNDYVANPWIAAAGLERGRVINSLAIEYSPTRAERDKLNAYNNINPYVNFKTDGIVRWGQNTLYRKSSALASENVRRMLFYAEKQLGGVLRYLNFEPNDPRTWKELKQLGSSVLDPIQSGRGLYDYRLICDDTTTTDDLIDQETVLAKILLKPTRIAKVIQLDWTILRTGAKFEEYI